ncbi:MAG: hypothetical protein IJ667_13375, partial [Synergistaceae bacterium]|nr:hypothetical protein [Synergistaceae bacterium]
MRSPYSEAYRILASLALAVLTGLIIRNFMTPETALMINANLFEPVRSIFINVFCPCHILFSYCMLCCRQCGLDADE